MTHPPEFDTYDAYDPFQQFCEAHGYDLDETGWVAFTAFLEEVAS